jgi:hypothetical protein
MGRQPEDIAIVLKALEIRAAKQAHLLDTIALDNTSLVEEAKNERRIWENALSDAGLNQIILNESSRPLQLPYLPLSDDDKKNWEQILAESESLLRNEGVSLEATRKTVKSSLETFDIVAALVFGALGAITPSLGSERGTINDAFNSIQKSADSNNLPNMIQTLFGGDKPAAFMDGGASGIYHRFVHGHDVFWAIPTGIQELGLIKGTLEVVQHLLRDSFGSTGIPMPGSTIIGESIAQFLGSGSINDIFSPRDLSRYSSFRMTDVAATGTVALLLWLYRKIRKIDSDSIRFVKMAIIAHSLCFCGLAVAALIPGLNAMIPYRSHLNYVSLTAVLYNTYRLFRLSSELSDKNLEAIQSIHKDIDRLSKMQAVDVAVEIDRGVEDIVKSI